MDSAQIIAVSATAATAVASAVNAVCVLVLARITGRYARSTAEILEESRKARAVAERQAAAAQAQAAAAQAQANAAHESLAILRQQLEDQLGLGHGIVQSSIQSAVSAIQYWKSQPLNKLATVRGLPPTDGLVPVNASAAVEHARRISIEGAQHLSAAFDDLR